MTCMRRERSTGTGTRQAARGQHDGGGWPLGAATVSRSQRGSREKHSTEGAGVAASRTCWKKDPFAPPMRRPNSDRSHGRGIANSHHSTSADITAQTPATTLPNHRCIRLRYAQPAREDGGERVPPHPSVVPDMLARRGWWGATHERGGSTWRLAPPGWRSRTQPAAQSVGIAARATSRHQCHQCD